MREAISHEPMMEMIDDIHPAPPPEVPFDLALLGLDDDAVLQPGVYFGLDEERYHNAFALSYSGIKDFRVSPLLWWAKSALNPRREQALAEEQPSEAKTLGQAFDARIICGRHYFDERYAPAISHADHPDSLRTMDDLKAWLEEHGLKKTGKTKADLIDRAVEADPTVKIWDIILDGYLSANANKTFLTPDWIEKIELAAAMIERHPELSKALQGGAPQVSVVWDCEKTGIRCKARFDYLKQKAIFDLKTLEPRGDLPLELAIAKEIGFRKYFIQASQYMEAARQIPKLIKAGMVHGDPPDPRILDLLVRHPDKKFGWLFQIKGPAPQAFGYMLPETSMLWQIGDMECDNAKHLFRHHLNVFGSDPWIEPTGFKNLDDANVPAWSMS